MWSVNGLVHLHELMERRLRLNCSSFDRDYRSSLYTPLHSSPILHIIRILWINSFLSRSPINPPPDTMMQCPSAPACHANHEKNVPLPTPRFKKLKLPSTHIQAPQFYKRRRAAAPMMSAARDDATTVCPSPVKGVIDLVAFAVADGAWICPSEIWVTGLPV